MQGKTKQHNYRREGSESNAELEILVLVALVLRDIH
jgi:hypothetical protein